MNKRNVVWLGVIVAAGVIAAVAFSLVWGLVAAGATLVTSETVERAVRKRRRARRGDTASPSFRHAIATRRRSR
jgi:hypothetical protein